MKRKAWKLVFAIIFLIGGFANIGKDIAPAIFGIVVGAALAFWWWKSGTPIKKEEPQTMNVRPSLPGLAPAEIDGHKMAYQYTDVQLYDSVKAPDGIKRGDLLTLNLDPTDTDPENVSVAWNGIKFGNMNDNRLRGMVADWMNAGLPVFCAMSDPAERNTSYIEFAFYGRPKRK